MDFWQSISAPVYSVPFAKDVWVTALSFLAVTGLLDFFDISLPRGDSTGVAGAICGCAIVVIGPVPAMVVSLLSAVLAHLTRRRFESPWRLAAVLASRGAGLGVGSLLIISVSGGDMSAIRLALIPGAYLLAEFVVAQLTAGVLSGRSTWRMIRGNLDSLAPILAAEWSASVLLLLTYGAMSGWSLIPVAVLLLLMRQSYAMFLDIREAYRTTVEVLIEAAESQDIRRVGHADRTAVLARSIAMKMGLSANEVDRISYAALLHDIGDLSEAPQEAATAYIHASSAAVVREVEFFRRIQPVLRVCDGLNDGDQAEDDDLLAALVVALASDIDVEYHPEVAEAHDESILGAVVRLVPPGYKARAVSAALRLGYRIPAVG